MEGNKYNYIKSGWPQKNKIIIFYQERIALKCIENKIALYSPHTSFDSIRGGVNDWLAGAFGIYLHINLNKTN